MPDRLWRSDRIYVIRNNPLPWPSGFKALRGHHGARPVCNSPLAERVVRARHRQGYSYHNSRYLSIVRRTPSQGFGARTTYCANR